MAMYQVKPFGGGDIIHLPTCMYRLPNIHTQTVRCADHVLQNGEIDTGLKALEERQDEILRRLWELKAAVDGLAKTVTTPDADLDATTVPPSPASASTFRGSVDLDSLLGRDLGALRDIVINASPSRPPLCLLVLHRLLCQRYQVLSSVHVHSSVSSVPPKLVNCLGLRRTDNFQRQRFQLGFTLIWKDVPKVQMKFCVPTMCTIEGEANVARFLFRLLGVEPQDPAMATMIDSWVDTAFLQLAQGGAKEQATVVHALNDSLSRSPWLVGAEYSLADMACASCLLQTGAAKSGLVNVQRWLKACQNLGHFNFIHALLQ
ncbi:aminoacyl tRNA synthase complex-interacting multifunctional protein 2 isoform X2 [Denticeps clupeoides]|uniref:Protein JTV-1 n=1 Tax=Denticeps clupeoides TaxID=299321 RepID=A0AAY4CHV8_9TELE|nr:aminoacyl tRNA synthase complex-interacting multifunctional protein 2 isoform X2 [Denticeps clupeoides]